MKSESLVIADQPCCGEYVSRALYTPPVKPPELETPEDGVDNRKESPCLGWSWQGGLSRNKVALPEGGAGSPPFLGRLIKWFMLSSFE